ncbi:MAG: O-antigen ligase family protein, partial [Armatimonadota bacterium]
TSCGLSYGLLLDYRFESRGLLNIAVPISLLDGAALLAAASAVSAAAAGVRRKPLPPYLIIPLLVYAASIALGIAMAFFNSNPLYAMFKDIRVQVYFLLALFITSAYAASADELRFLIVVIILAAVSVGVQQIVHVLTIDPGMALFQVRDVRIPVQMLPIATSFLIPLWVSRRRRRDWWFLPPAQALFLCAVLLSFTRSVWAQFALGIAMVLLFLSLRQRMVVVKALVISLPLVIFVTPILGRSIAYRQSLGALLAERVVSFAQGEEDASQAARLLEGQAALLKWLANPILGSGLGTEIESFDPVQGKMVRGEFLHNSLLYYAIKLGLPGLIGLIWIYAASVGTAVKTRSVPSLSCYAAGTVCALIPFALIGIWSGNLNHVAFSPLLGFLVGINWTALAAGSTPARSAEEG